MNVVMKKLDDLVPYVNNPRKNDAGVDKVASSIKNFGFKVPIVVDASGEIVCGHTRYLASKKLKLKEVPCVVADDLTDAQIKAFRIADNKVAEYSEWDVELLNIELEELKALDVDLDITGFDLDEIGDMLDEEKEIEEDNFDVDEAIEEIGEPTAKRGQIYKLGENRLMCGDSTSEDDVKALMDGEKADMVFTDPPYGIEVVGGGKAFGKVGDGKVVKANTYPVIQGDNSTEYAEKFINICKGLGIESYIIWGGNYFTKFLNPSMCWLVWDKENTGDFADVEMAWTSYQKGAKLYKWLWNGMVRKGDRDIEGNNRVHPTQKPVGLFLDIFNDFEFESCIDGFGGSGSTLMACEKAGKKCFMMELEPLYIDVIIRRWEEYTGQKAELIKG